MKRLVRTKSTISSYVKLQEIARNVPLLKIEDETSDDDEASASFQEFDSFYDDMKAVDGEKLLPYHATLFVAYFQPPNAWNEDYGPMQTFHMEKHTKNFNFFLYFATSRKKTCDHLTNRKKLDDDDQSELIKLINGGAVCYRQVSKLHVLVSVFPKKLIIIAIISFTSV